MNNTVINLSVLVPDKFNRIHRPAAARCLRVLHMFYGKVLSMRF